MLNTAMKNLELGDSFSDKLDDRNMLDCDLCDEAELQTLFNSKCDLVTEKSIDHAKDKYILHIDSTLETTPNIILGLSSKSSEIYNLSNSCLSKLHAFDVSDTIIGVKACGDNSNLFYVGTEDCHITLWDLRTPKVAVSIFRDTTAVNTPKIKNLNCFDVSSNNRLLSAGTDLFEGDAFILFWDVRSVAFLGGYWESHTDDITQVKFHPSDVNKLISGSTDGLINVYDLSQSSEDDAFIDSLNTEDAVQHLSWYEVNGTEVVSCVTYTNDLQLWKLDGVNPYAHFRRQDFATELKRKAIDYTYVASTHTYKNNVFVLAGSNFEGGECLRGFGVSNDKLIPAYNFKRNKQFIRSSWFNENTNVLLTGGEKSILNIWKIDPFNVDNCTINKTHLQKTF